MDDFAVSTQIRRPRARGQLAFLEALALTGNITEAANRANIHRSTHYTWLEKDPAGEYAKAVESILEEFRDAVRQEVRRRAFDGVRRPIMYQGAQVLQAVIDPETGQPRLDPKTQAPLLEPMWLVEKSDRMLELLAKAMCPEFRDKHEIMGEGGGPVKVLTVRYPIVMEDAEEWTRHFKPPDLPDEDEDDEQWSEQEAEAARFANTCAANVLKAKQAARDRIV